MGKLVKENNKKQRDIRIATADQVQKVSLCHVLGESTREDKRKHTSPIVSFLYTPGRDISSA